MRDNLISIIVPIYKVEAYLNKCLDSICNQTYKNLEIILVDDGSPDNSGKMCDDYAKKDSRIKVIHKENGGLSSARNAGLDIATGEYISFIDSDDYINAKFIETLYNLCIENNADISECDFLKFENDDVKEIKEEVNIHLYTSHEMQNRMYSEIDNVRSVVVWNKLYKKYIYENMRFPVGKINEDEFCTYRAFYSCKTKIATTSEKLHYYRYSPESIMGRKFNVKRLDVLDALKERKQFYKENNELELYEKTILTYSDMLKYFYELTKNYIENPKEHLKTIHNNYKQNYIDLKRSNKLNVKERIKNLIFVLKPEIYIFLKQKGRKEKIK